MRLRRLARPSQRRLFEPSLAGLITAGNFEDDLARLAECDWVIEAVAENLEIKTALLARVVPHLANHAVLTTNTSGLPIGQIAATLPAQSGPILRDALLQSAAVYAAAGGDSRRRDRCGVVRGLCGVCRSQPGQAGGVCATIRRTLSPTALGCVVMFQRGDADAGAGADD